MAPCPWRVILEHVVLGFTTLLALDEDLDDTVELVEVRVPERHLVRLQELLDHVMHVYVQYKRNKSTLVDIIKLKCSVSKQGRFLQAFDNAKV